MQDLNPAMLLGAWILSLLIAAIIFRLIFDVKKQLWFQQRQLDMLSKIAEHQGVPLDDIYEILNRK